MNRSAGRTLSAAAKPEAVLFSLGQSSGDTVRMIAVNDGNVAVEVALDAVVLEPVSGVTSADVNRSLASLAALPRIERTLKAYCRDIRRRSACWNRDADCGRRRAVFARSGAACLRGRA